jgi:ATP-binding cassette subfamily C (CFTR/MRP) protein 1
LYALLFAAQLATLVFWAVKPPLSIKTAVPSQALAVTVVPGLGVLSLLEHSRSPRTSDAINTYLFLSILFDAVQVRSLWLRLHSLKLAIAATSCLGLKCMLLIAEAHSKSRYLAERSKSLSPETLSGVFARRCFWWLNSTLARGYKSLIEPEKLDPIKDGFVSEHLLSQLEKSYEKSESDENAVIHTRLMIP